MITIPRGQLLVAAAALLTVLLAGAVALSPALFLPLVLGAGLVAAVVASIVKPRMAWVLFVFALFSNGLSADIGPVTLRPEHFALGLLLVPILNTTRYANKLKTNVAVASVVLSTWLILSVIVSSLLSPEPIRSYYIVFLYSASIFAALLTHSTGDLAWKAKSSVNVLSAMAAASIVSWILAETIGFTSPLVILNSYESTHRVQGLMVEPNFFGGACALWLCIVYALRSQFSKRALTLHSTLLVSAVLLSFTRAAWLVVAVIIVTAALRSSRRRFVKVLALVGGVTVVFVTVLGGAREGSAGAIVDRIENFFDFQTGSGGFRARDWSQALEQLSELEGWIVGLGVNSYSQRNASTQTSSGEAYLGNFWLTTLYDTGVIGLFLIGIGLAFFWFANRGTSQIPMALLAVCITVTAAGTNQMWFAYPWIAIALLAGDPVGHPNARPSAAVSMNRASTDMESQ